MTEITYMVEIKPEWGGRGYEWRICADPTPNQYGHTIEDVLSFDGGYSSRSLQHTANSGTAATRDEAEAQARLAIEAEEAMIRYHAALDDGLEGRQERLLVKVERE